MQKMRCIGSTSKFSNKIYGAKKPSVSFGFISGASGGGLVVETATVSKWRFHYLFYLLSSRAIINLKVG
ncbi:MAG: hypothetical protein ACPLKV_00025 [Minisyncoccia bacterium]